MPYEDWVKKQVSTVDPTFLGGGYESRRLNGKHPTGVLYIDDIHDINNNSEKQRRDVVKALTTVILKTVIRVNDKLSTWVLGIGVPWASDDGYQTMVNAGYGYLTIPAMTRSFEGAEGAVYIDGYNPAANVTYEDIKGWWVLTWPENFGVKAILQERSFGKSEFWQMIMLDLATASTGSLAYHEYPADQIKYTWVTIVLAGRRVRARLRRDTGALLSDAALGPLRLQRAKFKPGRYLRASYQAALSPNNGGTIKARPIEVTWNADGMEVCHPLQPDLLDLQAEAIRSGLAAPFERLAARLPSVDACIQISPLDAAFPQLMRLSDPQFVQELLREVLDRRPGPDTNKLPFHYSVTPIRYRPGQRHVLRYDFAFGDGRSSEQGTIFAKLYQQAARGPGSFN